MTYRLPIINLCLAMLFVFFTYKAYQVWTTDQASFLPVLNATEKSSGNKASAASRSNRNRGGIPASKSMYSDVTDKNLFSLERTESVPVEAVVEQIVQSKVLRVDGKKIELYGVVVMENHVTAMISDPDVKNRKRPTRWVKIGDQVGQFKIKSISKEHIIMSEGSDQFKVVLWDENRKRKPSTAPVQEKPTVVVSKAPPKRSPKPASVQAPKAKTDANKKTMTINTPFGKIKRRK